MTTPNPNGPSLTPPSLEFAFSVRLQFGDGPRLRFNPAFTEFTRGFVSVLGGEITGPRLTGRVVPQTGGDWPRLWRSGYIEFEAHYIMEVSDGTPIYIWNRGIAYSSPETLKRIEAGEVLEDNETYCRITPRFEVPAGPHDWLVRTVLIGKGERRGSHSVFDYYAVT
jgi:Protein of unknown function (DUF3237)